MSDSRARECILLVGGGGHCRACIDVIEQQNRFQIAGIIDQPERRGTAVLGYPVIGTDADLQRLVVEVPNALVTLGQIRTAHKRVQLFEQLLEHGYTLPVVISPQAYVSPHANIGAGTIVMHQALVNAGAHVGHNCILNSKSLIEHDARIDNHCHISTAAVVNGGASIGEESFVGSNATTVENARIEAQTFIKAHTLFLERDHD